MRTFAWSSALILSATLLASCGQTGTPSTNTNILIPAPTNAAQTVDNGNQNTTLPTSTASGATITLPKTTYAPGEALEATFMSTEELDAYAWIGVIPAETPHGREKENDAADVAYMYLEKKTSGIVELNAPTTPGRYDLRLNSSDNEDGVELATSPAFTVQ